MCGRRRRWIVKRRRRWIIVKRRRIRRNLWWIVNRRITGWCDTVEEIRYLLQWRENTIHTQTQSHKKEGKEIQREGLMIQPTNNPNKHSIRPHRPLNKPFTRRTNNKRILRERREEEVIWILSLSVQGTNSIQQDH